MALEDVFSDFGLTSCGVPQRYILGPLLFLIHITDLPHVLNETGWYLYAQGNCIFYQDKHVEKSKKC